MDSLFLFYGLLFLIAFLYASVGHGGASGYLALMAIYSITPEVMKPTALLLNLFVSGISFVQYYRGNHFQLKIFIPLAVASIPLAFVGGMTHVDAEIYKKILGGILIIPIIRFLFFTNTEISKTNPSSAPVSFVIGAFIGYISGLIGIGGGIILSPILLFLKWTDQKQTAAISALFIFVNSFSGLAGQITKGIQFDQHMYTYVLIAFAGGCLGAYFGAMKFKQHILKNILVCVLLLAVYKLLFTNA